MATQKAEAPRRKENEKEKEKEKEKRRRKNSPSHRLKNIAGQIIWAGKPNKRSKRM